ncbi:unnamed protein product, partial [Larinioides sclopetarius]
VDIWISSLSVIVPTVDIFSPNALWIHICELVLYSREQSSRSAFMCYAIGAAIRLRHRLEKFSVYVQEIHDEQNKLVMLDEE